MKCKENHKSMLQKTDEDLEKKKNINLLDCVKLFMVEEQLGEEDPRYIGMFCNSDNHVNVYALTHPHTHTHIHTYTHSRMHMHIHVHMHTHRVILVYT